AIDQYDVRREFDQFHHIFANPLGANAFGVICAPTIVDPHVAAVSPAQLLELLQKRTDPCHSFRIVRGQRGQHADAPHSLALLRPRRERPRRRRAAEQRDELAPFHSITSSARWLRNQGTSSPSALAVLRLITRSNFVGCCTGRSAGFSPRRMRST